MEKNDRLPEIHPDDGDEVEILEVVGLDEDGSAAGPAGTAPEPVGDGEEDPDEYVLDFDDPEQGVGGEGLERPVGPETSPEEDHQRLVQLRADYDNLRKRIDRERAEFELCANFALVARLLPVLDNLERALASETASGGVGALREGLVMIHRQLTDQLREEGLRAIDTVGQPFDPNLHDAVATDPTSDHPAHTILEELQKGYLFQDRVLRPAMVKVSIGREKLETDEDA